MTRRPTRWQTLGLIVLALFVAGMVSPLSYLPNPLGLYYLVVGGYEYDPQSPFVNRFATLGARDPRPHLTAQLDRLLGQTGLDPLDPVQPLTGYRFVSVLTRPRGVNLLTAAATVEFRYADGGARTYTVPYFWRRGDRLQYSGLDRPLARHEELPWLPAAGPDTAIALGTPERLTGPTAQLATAPLDFWSSAYWSWTTTATSQGGVRVLPDGQGFLLLYPAKIGLAGPFATYTQAYGDLWLVSGSGALPQRLAQDVQNFVVSTDGAWLVAVRARTDYDYGPRTVTLINTVSGAPRDLGRTDIATAALDGQAAYWLDNGTLWRAPLAGGPAARLGILPDATATPAAPAATDLVVSPDGARVAYRCQREVCVADVTGANVTRVALGYQPYRWTRPGEQASRYDSFGLAWSPDGARLAVTIGSCCLGPDGVAPKIRMLDHTGTLLQELALGPDGMAWAPQWTPDGRFIFINAFPRGGRRIVAVDTAAGQVADLSQPGWDAFFGLAPDGQSLVAWNGQGGFWRVPLTRR